MTLIVNGHNKDFIENSSIEDILKNLDAQEHTMAVAVNSQVIKKKQWKEYQPNQNDKLELLNFVGGG